MDSFRLALTEQLPLLCRCHLPAPSPAGDQEVQGGVHVPRLGAWSAELPLVSRLLRELVLSAAVRAWLGYPAVVHSTTRVRRPSCPFTSSRGINVFVFGFSRNTMRLPRLTGRAECKPFLDGSLPDLLLKTADPGNLPLQLISKKKSLLNTRF